MAIRILRLCGNRTVRLKWQLQHLHLRRAPQHRPRYQLFFATRRSLGHRPGVCASSPASCSNNRSRATGLARRFGVVPQILNLILSHHNSTGPARCHHHRGCGGAGVDQAARCSTSSTMSMLSSLAAPQGVILAGSNPRSSSRRNSQRSRIYKLRHGSGVDVL